MYLVEESVHTHVRNRKRTVREANDMKDVNRSTNELVENGRTPSVCSNGHSHV